MTRPARRPQQQSAWLDGFRSQPSVEAACQALEARLRTREGLRPSWSDALARCPEAEWWAL